MSQQQSKRRKTARACKSCKESHVTCEDARPCRRCVKRGCGDTCEDGPRKLPGYLRDIVTDADALKTVPTANCYSSTTSSSAIVTPPAYPSASDPNPSSSTSSHQQQTSQPSQHHHHPFSLTPISPFNNTSGDNTTVAASGSNNADFLQAAYNNAAALTQACFSPNIDAFVAAAAVAAAAASTTTPQPVGTTSSTHTHHHPVAQHVDSAAAALFSIMTTPTDIYSTVTTPYDYREGFHYLLSYIKQRMCKEDVMRICKAIAHFRPSFMAQIMDLSESDLVFMEKCFQRTLMQYEKIISTAGTPTVIWRRTGEIALVGKEFSYLTQWSSDQLLPNHLSPNPLISNRKSYIWELMTNESAVRYWELFSKIAFDNSNQKSAMSTCTLLSPTGRDIPCAFCVTIKRDIFDVPLAIVGNFLPIFQQKVT